MAAGTGIHAIVLAGGLGRRLGADKALQILAGRTLIEHLVSACTLVGLERPIVVRRPDAGPLPALVQETCDIVLLEPVVDGEPEMLDSLRTGLSRLPPGARGFLSFPVDHGMVQPATLALLVCRFEPGAVSHRILLPLHDGRPGHPILLHRELAAEVLARGTGSLREVIRKDKDRVLALPVRDPAVVRDLDTPEDLAMVRDAMRALPLTTMEIMRRHRSHRSFRSDPLDEQQLARLVDAARYASTSSYIQAYSVVAVRDRERKAACARLCADQQHIHEAPVFLAVCADLHKIGQACRRLDRTLNPDSLEIFLQATVDAALLGQNLLLAAEAEGLGGCMLGAARNHPMELAKVLGLPRHVYVVFGLVLGIPADDPVPRGRMCLEAVLHHEHYDLAAADRGLDDADRQMREFARRVNAEQGGYLGRPVNEQKGWAERMAALWSRELARPNARNHLPQELRALGFGLLLEQPEQPDQKERP